jgi:hypothetical protein
LAESITDPYPLENAAWVNALAGEVADLCVFAKYGHAAYTTVYARNGKAYTAQKSWSNYAFLQHFGTPATGCVDYPTTLCCNDAQSTCTWLGYGQQSCPNPTGSNPSASADPNGIVVTAPTLGGFGSGTATVTRQTVDRILPLGITNWLAPQGGTMSPTIFITSDTALVGASTACFAAITDATEKEIVQCVSMTPGLSCQELKGFVQDGPSGPQCCIPLPTAPSVDGTQVCARFPVLGTTVIDVPALPGNALALGSVLLLGLGTLGARKRIARSWN